MVDIYESVPSVLDYRDYEGHNAAFIDNQNLYMATTYGKDPWRLDMKRLLVYLQQKYDCLFINLFMGAYEQRLQNFYLALQRMGYVLIYREHSQSLKGNKKGNVDTDIVFEVMSSLIDDLTLEKVVLVSGDGDYKRMVDYLIEKGRFEKILFPSKERASSLYKSISRQYYAYLDTPDMRAKLGFGHRK